MFDLTFQCFIEETENHGNRPICNTDFKFCNTEKSWLTIYFWGSKILQHRHLFFTKSIGLIIYLAISTFGRPTWRDNLPRHINFY